MSGPETHWEYQTFPVDAWQVHHLCNRWEIYGWEPVSVFPDKPGGKVPARIGDDSADLVDAVHPVYVLFRRQIPAEEPAG